MASKRLPGNKVVRRRRDATRVIAIPEAPPRREIPHVRTHAKRFAGAFLLLVLLGAALLSMPWVTESGERTAPIDAFFTAISAAAVTGLVVVDTQDHWNLFGEIVILLLIQAGGLGFMVGASLVLASLGRGVSLRDSLMLQDGSPTLTLDEAGTLSKRILRYILLCEALGAIVLTGHFLRDQPPGIAIWYGVFHSISAFCNAGFDLQGNFLSLSEYADSPVINIVIMLLIQAGALSFLVVNDVWLRRSWRRFSFDTKLIMVTNAIMLVVGALLFLMLEWNRSMASVATWAKPMTAMFQSTSARTAGFASVPFNEVQSPTEFLWVALMMVGGAAGSTAGGIKLASLAIIVIAVMSTIRGQPEAQAFGRRVSPQLVFRAMAIIALFLFVHFLLTLGLAMSEDVIGDRTIGFLPIMFETMSAMATVGLSTGITPDLTAAGKIILCVGMFFGRLGPLTAVYALQRRQHPPRYRFAESLVRLG
jgi:trk system potassium uptake protein TrkH